MPENPTTTKTTDDQVVSIPISAIEVGKRMRSLKPEKLEGLEGSIAEVGLVAPITVRQDGEGYRLVCGAHRLEACRRTGSQTIPAFVATAGDLDCELMEIDENLIRSEGPGRGAGRSPCTRCSGTPSRHSRPSAASGRP